MEQNTLWIILGIGVVCLLLLAGSIWFGHALHANKPLGSWVIDFFHHFLPRPVVSGALNDALSEYLNKRNEFWSTYGQFVLSVFVIMCITILLLTKTISPESGLPILSGIGGFAIGKGINTVRNVPNRDTKEQ